MASECLTRRVCILSNTLFQPIHVFILNDPVFAPRRDNDLFTAERVKGRERERGEERRGERRGGDGEERGRLRWGERGCCEGMKDDEEGSEGERE